MYHSTYFSQDRSAETKDLCKNLIILIFFLLNFIINWNHGSVETQNLYINIDTKSRDK